MYDLQHYRRYRYFVTFLKLPPKCTSLQVKVVSTNFTSLQVESKKIYSKSNEVNVLRYMPALYTYTCNHQHWACAPYLGRASITHSSRVLLFQGCFDAGVKYLKENSDIIIGFGITLCFLLVSAVTLSRCHACRAIDLIVSYLLLFLHISCPCIGKRSQCLY